MIPMNIHEKIKQLRKQRGINQKDLAFILAVSQSKISKIEKGKLEPSIDELKSLSCYFKITVKELIYFSEIAFDKSVKTTKERERILSKRIKEKGKQSMAS